MVIENLYNIGDFVYIVTDSDQLRRQVTGIIVTGTTLIYELQQGTGSSKHYEFELSAEKQYKEV